MDVCVGGIGRVLEQRVLCRVCITLKQIFGSIYQYDAIILFRTYCAVMFLYLSSNKVKKKKKKNHEISTKIVTVFSHIS